MVAWGVFHHLQIEPLPFGVWASNGESFSTTVMLIPRPYSLATGAAAATAYSFNPLLVDFSFVTTFFNVLFHFLVLSFFSSVPSHRRHSARSPGAGVFGRTTVQGRILQQLWRPHRLYRTWQPATGCK